jgi:hypothetical protein
MTYQTMSQLRVDQDFFGRVQSCVVEQSRAVPTDAFTRQIKLNTMTITGMFVNLMVTDPALVDAYETGGIKAITDEMVLTGVQAEWAEISMMYMSAYAPPAPAAPLRSTP